MSLVESKGDECLQKNRIVGSIANCCPRCAKGPMIFDSTRGEMFCSNCGYVVKDRTETEGQQLRTFPMEGKIEHTYAGLSSSLALHDMGLSTQIGSQNRDAYGTVLSASMKVEIERLRTWDRRILVHESDDRNRRRAFIELDTMVDKLNVNDAVIEKAAYIYRKALVRGLIRGRSISAMIAACVYAACRDTETPRTLIDISKVSNVKKKDLARNYRVISRELDLRMPLEDPTKCVSKIASKAGISERTKRRALDILRRAKEAHMTAGKNPVGLAAAALYIACVMENEDTTQKDVAEAAGVTEVTIRNRYRGLQTAIGLQNEVLWIKGTINRGMKQDSAS